MVHILIIDDRRDDRMLAARELERAIPDLTITEVASAPGFTQALAASDFDLAVVDYQLRWSDGVTLLRAIKARRPECPVVMFSATATAEDAVAAMREGLDDYVSKSPRHYSRLAIAVRAALERAASRRRISALEQEQIAALQREHDARRVAERAREQLAFLVEAGVVLSSSLDYPTTLQRVADLAVPQISDWCAVDMLTEDGQLLRVATAHTDPAKVALASELNQRYPPNPNVQGGVWQVIRSGEPALYPAVSDELLVALAQDAEHLAILRAVGMRSGLIVPLSSHERVLGTLTLVMAESGRSYSNDDLGLAAALGRRAALAIASARLYAAAQRERVAAEQLADRLARLQKVTAALAAAVQPEDVARAVAEQCVEALGARASAVMSYDPGEHTLQLLYEVGYGDAFSSWHRFSADGPYPFSEAVRERAPIYMSSRDAFNARYPGLAASPTITEAAAYLPLLADGQPIGGMSIGFLTPRVLGADERAFLEALASQCAQALDRARLYAAEQRARERQTFLDEVSTQLMSSLDYNRRLELLVDLCVPHLGDWCVVDMPAEDGLIVMQILAHVDPAKVQWAREVRERYAIRIDDQNAAAHVIRTGAPLLLAEITDEQLQEAARDEEELRLIHLIGYRSVMVVPLRAHSRVIGSLGFVISESERRYTPDDVTLAEELARRAGIALENARLYGEAQAAVQARDQFLAVASHELKTPLTALLGHTELIARRLSRGEGDPRIQRSVQVIANQGQRLSRLINALLDLSRIENGQLTLILAPLDLCTLAEQVVAELTSGLERQRIDLSAPAEPVVVLGDALRLEQVLVNLLQNAVKYSPENAPIAVQVARQGNRAAIVVRDEGIGVPELALPHVFSRFYRAPNVDPQHISGMGMGLFLVRETVARHGGEVEIVSAEGRGSTVTVLLPLAPEAGLGDHDNQRHA